MSEVVASAGNTPKRNSLAARVAERRKAISNAKARIFPVPGFEDIMGVELRPLNPNEGETIAERLDKIPDEREKLRRFASEIIIKATCRFFGISEDGEWEEDEHATWRSLFTDMEQAQGRPAPDPSIPERACLVGVLKTQHINLLFNEYTEWANSGRVAGDTQARLDRE